MTRSFRTTGGRSVRSVREFVLCSLPRWNLGFFGEADGSRTSEGREGRREKDELRVVFSNVKKSSLIRD